MTLIQIDNYDNIEDLKNSAFDNKCDESLGAAEIVNYLLEQGQISLPLQVFVDTDKGPRIDVIIRYGTNTILAAEVTRLTWPALQRVLKEAQPSRIDEQGNAIKADWIELNPRLCNDINRETCNKRQRNNIRNDDLNCIKKFDPLTGKHQKFDGPGWVGDEMEIETIQNLEDTIKKKQKKFDKYKKESDHIWLFLIADGLVGAWENILSNSNFMKQVDEICAKSNFECILLFRFSHGTCELYKR